MGEPAKKLDDAPGLRVDAAALREAMGRMLKPRANTLPILDHVLLRCDGQLLGLTTSNLQQWITVEVPASGALSTTVPAALLSAALNGLEGGVELELAGQQVMLRHGRRRFMLDTLPAEDFPMPDDAKAQRVEVGREGLREALKRVQYAMAKKDVRHYLLGISLGECWAVATNGHRMAAEPVPADHFEPIILPRDVVPTIIELLDEDGVQIALLKTDVGVASIRVTTKNTTLRANLLDGRFPDWRRVMPKITDDTPRATFDTHDMLAAIQRVEAFVKKGPDGESWAARMSLQKGEIVLEAQGAKDVVACSEHQGEAEIGLNLGYLRDVCRLAKKTVTWECSGISSPSLFSLDDDKGGAYHTIMPARL